MKVSEQGRCPLRGGPVQCARPADLACRAPCCVHARGPDRRPSLLLR